MADELMTGHRGHDLLENDDVLTDKCVAYTHRKFSMFRKNLGKASYPIILPPTEDHPGTIARAELAPVRGEVYFVKPYQMIELDNYKNNGVVFNRERVFLDIPYREVELRDGERILGEWKHHKSMSAWMYIANPEYFFWNNYIENDSFSPLKLKIPADRNLSPFYYYTAKDDLK